MKATIKTEKEVNIKSVIIDVNPRHLDEEEKPVPLLVGAQWRVKVDIDSGRIENWPKGEEREYYWKICDAGSYYLLDETDEIVLSIDNNYVPNNLLPGEYGDYLDLKINSDGVITNWLYIKTLEDFYPDED